MLMYLHKCPLFKYKPNKKIWMFVSASGTCIRTIQDTTLSQLTHHHQNLEANILNNLNETTCTALAAKSSDSVGFVAKLQVNRTCVTGHEVSIG